MEKITIGIIGGGRIGRMHAGTIYTGMQDVTIKYVSDIYPQAAQQWGPMYGVPERRVGRGDRVQRSGGAGSSDPYVHRHPCGLHHPRG